MEHGLAVPPIAPPRTPGEPGTLRVQATLEPAQLLVRGPLASRAYRLLGLGAVGSARLGQSQPALTNAFGGDVVGWSRAGTPWIAARSLARERETLLSRSAVGWLLSSGGAGFRQVR